jgi:hypothetical protein
MEATDECTLSNLIVGLKWLHNEGIRQEEDATAAQFSSHRGGDVARTLAIDGGPERPARLIADPCPQPTLVKSES